MPKNPVASLYGLFYPESVAVVGASENVSKIGGYIFSQLLHLKNCELYPINIKNETIQGKKAFPSLEQLPKSVDLAVVAIPQAFVLETLEDCVKKNIKNIVIITAGFKETGPQGAQEEEKIKELVKKHKLNVIGPNCLGFLNPQIQLNASFAKEIPEFGSIGLISQSGAVVDALLDWSFEHHIGFSKVVSIGNMAGVNELDMLEYLSQDPNTHTIVFYMESLEDGEEFAKKLKKISRKKPVVILKPGNSKNAQKAIGSHTGSLAQDGVLVEKLITQNNGIFVKTIDELYNMLILLNSKTPKPTSNNLAIVTNAGGPGVIATDMLDKTSLQLAKLDHSTKKELASLLPDAASPHNPVDVLGDATSKRYVNTIKVLLKKKEVGSILVLLTPQIMTDSGNLAREIVEILKTAKKPIMTSFLGGKEVQEAHHIFKEHAIPHFSTPNQALQALNYFTIYHNFNFSDKLIAPEISTSQIDKIKKILAKKQGLLDYKTTKKILQTLHITPIEKTYLETKEDILTTTLPTNTQYVLKAEQVLHKKEENAVHTSITSLNFQEVALEMFSQLESKGFVPTLTLEQKYVGKEAIIGLKSHGDLGKFIMFGTGGSYVSVYNDITFSQAPLTKKEAVKLVESTHIAKLLKGHRGERGIDLPQLYELLVKLSFLQTYFEEIEEVDCNPVICNEKGLYLVDVKLLVSKN